MYKSQRGQSLVELLVTIGLAGILLPALITGLYATRGGRSQQDQRQQAIAYVREGVEATRAFEEGDWATFSSYSAPTPTPRYPSIDTTTNTWTLPIGSESLSGGFTRSISITPVYRDFTTNPPSIVASGGTLDPSTVQVVVTVSWSNPIPASVTATEYLTRKSNLTQTDTSVNDFSRTGYTLSSVQLYSPSSSNTSTDGEILLSSASNSDWCSPGLPVASTNLGGNGLAGSVVAGVNRAFVGTGQNASSHPFYNVTIDYSGATPNPSVASNGYYDASGLKSNDVFGETTYAYLATPHNGNRWVVILNVASNPPTLVATIPSQNNSDATSIFVANNGSTKMLYFTAGSVLYRYDVTTPASPVAKGTFTLSASANKLYVVNNYVYIALNSTTNQLQVVDANDVNTMKNPGGGSSAVVLSANSQPAVGIYVLSDNSRVYLVTSQANPDFYIIKPNSTTTPTSWSVVGSGYSTGTMNPKGLTVIDNRAIIVGFTNPRYQVLKVKDSLGNDTYTWCNATSASEPDDIYNVSSQYVSGHAYSYIVTANTNSAFEMIEGGTGGSGLYATSGTYTSGPWSPSPIKSAVFNRIDVTVHKPSATTDVKLQVGLADVGASTTCSDANFTYVGPTGTGSYFSTGVSDVTTSIALPFPPSSGWSSFINPGKCFAYKAYLYASSDQTQTPYVADVTWSYSP